MNAIGLLRTIANAVIIVFAIIVLGITANLVSGTKDSTPSWLGFTLFVAIFTLLIAVPVLVIEQLRNGAITGIIAVEIAWTGLLGLFWLSAAAAGASSFIIGDCSSYQYYGGSEFVSVCHQYKAMQAFSWLSWLILWGWMLILLVLSIVSMTRGNKRVFMSPAGQTDFFARDHEQKVPPVQYQNTGSTVYPPTQQSFAPQFAPQFHQPGMTGQPAAQV